MPHARIVHRERIKGAALCGGIGRGLMVGRGGTGRALQGLRLPRLVGCNGLAHQCPHSIQPLGLVHVVEIAAAVGQALGEHSQATHGTGGSLGLHAPGVGARAGFCVAVVVTAHHQQRGAVLLAQGLGYVGQVASIKGHGHRVARGFMQACGCGVALGHQQHQSPRRITAPVPQARLAPALQKQLVGAIGWALGGYALQVPQLARCIAHRHQQAAVRGKAHTVGVHALAGQIRAVARGAGCLPLTHRISRCSSVRGLLLGLLGPLALCLLALTLGQHFGARGLGRFGGLGQHKAVLFGQVQQRANAHAPARFDAAPGAARGPWVVVVCRGAPGFKQVLPGGVGKLAFDGHAHPRPILTRQVSGDVRQGCADQVGGDGSFCHRAVNRSGWELGRYSSV